MTPLNNYANREQLARLVVESIDDIGELRRLAELAMEACYAKQLGNDQGQDSFESDVEMHGDHLADIDWDQGPESIWVCGGCSGREIEIRGFWLVNDGLGYPDPDDWRPTCGDCNDETHAIQIAQLPLWGCVAWLDEGSLIAAEWGEFENNGLAAGVDVCAPPDQKYLDGINTELGSKFKLEEFAGR